MKEAQFKSISYWEDTTEFQTYDALEENMDTEVLVVGAGISGLLAAYRFSEIGKKVTVIDMKHVGKGATANTTARITAQQGPKYTQLVKDLGEDKAKLYYESQIESIDALERIINTHNIDCDFERLNSNIYAEQTEGAQTLKEEAKTYEKLNIEGTYSEASDLPFEVTGMLTMPNQAQFHPLKFLKGLLNVFETNENFNVTVYEHTRARDIKDNTLITENGTTIDFDYVCITTHFPFLDYKGLYFNSFKVHQSFAAVAATKAPVPIDSNYSGADTPGLSYRNVRDQNHELPLILFGGLGNLTSDIESNESHTNRLKFYAQQRTPIDQLLYTFQAQDMITVDSIPYIGYFDDNTNRFVASGFNKYGMTNGMLAANIFVDLATTGENKYADLVSPHRDKSIFKRIKTQMTTPLEGVKAEVKNLAENVVSIKDVQLEPGEGTLVRDGAKVKGLFKSPDTEKIYAVSSRCTHMGCTVKWNDLDRTWDCPCHGSRFNHTGEIIEGPAVDNLECEVLTDEDLKK